MIGAQSLRGRSAGIGEGFRLPAGLWCAVFAILVLVTRLGNLHDATIDWDEATFMLMAQDLVRGHLPYVHLFDNKPPMMFFSLAAMMEVFGQSLATVRLFGALCVLASAIATYGVCRRFAGDLAAGLAASLLVAAESTVSFGLFTSTELPTAALIMAAAWLMLSQGQRLSSAVLVGVCASAATLFRSNVEFVAISLGLLYVLGYVRPSLRLHKAAAAGYVAGGLVPLALVLAPYVVTRQLAVFFLSTVTVALSYAEPPRSYLSNGFGVLRQAWAAGVADPVFAVYAILSIAGLAASLAPRPRVRRGGANRRLDAAVPGRGRDFVIVAVFLLSSLMSLVMAGLPYNHYLLIVMPFGAIGCALVFDVRTPRAVGVLSMAVGLAALAAALVATLPASADMASRWRSVTAGYGVRRAAEAIAADRRPGDQVWPLADHIVLFFLNEPPPSPLATHPDNVLRPEIYAPLAKAGYAPADPFDELMARAPRYILFDDREFVPYYIRGDRRARMQELLRTRYGLWGFFGHVVVYRRAS